MDGSGGMYHQKNMEKRRAYSVREWADICMKSDLRAPTREELGRLANPDAPARARKMRARRRTRANDDHVTVGDDEEDRLPTPAPEEHEVEDAEDEPTTPVLAEESSVKARSEPPEDDDDDEQPDDEKGVDSLPTPPHTVIDSPSETPEKLDEKLDEAVEAKEAAKAAKKAKIAAKRAKDMEWLNDFDPSTHWLPPGLKPEDYDPDFCQLLEKAYWRSIGLQGKRRPMYGADLEGTYSCMHHNLI